MSGTGIEPGAVPAVVSSTVSHNPASKQASRQASQWTSSLNPNKQVSTLQAPSNRATMPSDTTKDSKFHGNMLTNSDAFKKLVDIAFDACNSGSSDKEVGKAELYAGLLFVHLKIAKFVGPAATHPPSREAVDEMFEAADKDNSGGIDKNEFVSIIAASCANLLGRITIYLIILIFIVPYLATHIVDMLGIKEDGFGENVAAHITKWSLYFAVVPMFIDFIDRKSQSTAAHVKVA